MPDAKQCMEDGFYNVDGEPCFIFDGELNIHDKIEYVIVPVVEISNMKTYFIELNPGDRFPLMKSPFVKYGTKELDDRTTCYRRIFRRVMMSQ